MARAWVNDLQQNKKYRDAVAKAKAAKRQVPNRWMVRYYDPTGRIRSAGTFKKKPEAEKRRSEIENQISEGAYRDPTLGKVRVETVAESWWKSKTDLEEGSRNLYRDHLDNYVLPRWGGVRVSAVRYQDVADWVLALQTEPRKGGDKPISAATIRGVHLVLLSVLEWAVKSEFITRNPARGVPLPKLPPRGHVYLSHVDVERLALAAGTHGTVVRFLAYTGLRWSEASALTVGRLNLDNRRAHIDRAYKDNKGKLTLGQPKKGEVRSVPVPAFLVGELRDLVGDRSPDDLLFTAPRGGPIWLRNWRPRVFNRAVKDADLGGRGLTPHKLRHTAASLAIAAGADVYVVQTMLGHRKPSITLDTYGHLWPDRLDEVADALGATRAEHLARLTDSKAA
ncbi:site-specific integrase [Streptomonospora alba]|uniref:site-specific integrase n=1 Tax=Streptomonospora alba TaxID=183763 RepID=UPI00069B6E35|nr:site-specific integrase [Streptomonospora alba]